MQPTRPVVQEWPPRRKPPRRRPPVKNPHPAWWARRAHMSVYGGGPWVPTVGIGGLASALHRSTSLLTQLERRGILPRAPIHEFVQGWTGDVPQGAGAPPLSHRDGAGSREDRARLWHARSEARAVGPVRLRSPGWRRPGQRRSLRSTSGSCSGMPLPTCTVSRTSERPGNLTPGPDSSQPSRDCTLRFVPHHRALCPKDEASRSAFGALRC